MDGYERETERQTDRQTDRQTQTDIMIERDGKILREEKRESQRGMDRRTE